MYDQSMKNETQTENGKMQNVKPAPGMYFSAIRNRDDKMFVGQIESVKNMGMKGKMIVVKLADSGKYASIYLDDCYDYAWSDFPLGELVGR